MQPAVAKNLVDLLSTDDAFRALFVSDTVAALLQAGYTPVPGDDLEVFAKECCKDIKLADKAAIAAALEATQAMLIKGINQTVPSIGSGTSCVPRTLK
nr:NHLP-related RiPP peptide [Xanthomonas maliensis]